jgi:ubiquitin-protein ligase
MIDFSCVQCDQLFSVPEAYAGRTARCKRCGTALQVPAAKSTARAPQQPAAKLPMRTRRQMRSAFDGFDAITITATDGEPPEKYQIRYRVRGLEPGPDDKPRSRDEHIVEIQLTRDYPRLAPKCRVITPIFHPNIDPATICIGDHWTAGERLVDLVTRIGEMIAYQAYNIKSPLDGEAAMWADLNANNLPTDPRNLRPHQLD